MELRFTPDGEHDRGSRLNGLHLALHFDIAADKSELLPFNSGVVITAAARAELDQHPDVLRYRDIARQRMTAKREAEKIAASIQALEGQSKAVKDDMPEDTIQQLTELERQLTPLRFQQLSAKSILEGIDAILNAARTKAEAVGKSLAVPIFRQRKAELNERRMKAYAALLEVAGPQLMEIYACDYGANTMIDVTSWQGNFSHLATAIQKEPEAVQVTTECA